MSESANAAPSSWALGAAGTVPEVEFNGKAWKVGHPVQRAREILEEWTAAQALREVQALKPYLDPQAYDEAKKDIIAMIGGRWYRTGGQGWVKAIEGADGHLLFLFALLRVHQPDSTVSDAMELLAAKPDELMLALERVCPDFFSEIVRHLPVAGENRAGYATRMRTDFLAALRQLSQTLATKL